MLPARLLMLHAATICWAKVGSEFWLDHALNQVATLIMTFSDDFACRLDTGLLSHTQLLHSTHQARDDESTGCPVAGLCRDARRQCHDQGHQWWPEEEVTSPTHTHTLLLSKSQTSHLR